MKITMAHGSGGRSSADLMESIFAKHFNNPVLERLEDAAVLEIAGKIAYSTDSFVVTPTVFPGGDIGKLAVCGTVNDLLMMGAVPRYLTSAYILEEGLSFDELDTIAASMAETARKASVDIVAGDTKVIEGKGGLLINTSGIGIIPEGRHVAPDRCEAGDVVLLSGTLGDHHVTILQTRLEMESTFSSDCAVLAPLVDALFEAKIDVKAMRDVTRGGLGTVLNELSMAAKTAIDIQETSLPVREDVAGFCGILGLDPLYMGNEGKMVAIVGRADADAALASMQSTPLGRDAVILGHLKPGSGVTMTTRFGGKRVIDMLYGEGLPRIC